MSSRFLPAALVLAAVLAGPPPDADGQVLRLNSLKVPADASPGPWVAYRVSTQSRSLPPRELTQRVALVSAEGIGEDAGVWVELKTVDPQTGTRIDRGFYGRPSGDGASGGSGPTRTLTLRRVQRLHPDGRLYEYPPNSAALLRGDDEVSMLGLFEISGTRPPLIDTLGVDTLRIGRRTLPSIIIRKQWVGNDEWAEEGAAYVNRVMLTLTEHICPEVPLTGFTQSSYEVTTARFAVADSLRERPLAPSDSTAAQVVYRTELRLGDMGTGAVPEVTQEPEPAPDAEAPDPRPGLTR